MGTSSPPPARPFTLRQLPLPAKLVLSVFLLAVGLGYFSALVQLHLQHSGRNGEPMPSLDDVVERFAGVKRYDGIAPKSKVEVLVAGSRDAATFGKSNMTPAFFDKSGAEYKKACAERGEPTVTAEREGELLAFVAWINSNPAGVLDGARSAAYEADKFKLPADFPADQPISEDFFSKDEKTVAIKSLVEARCVRCHADGNTKPALDEYTKLAPLVTAAPLEVISGKWVRSGRQMTVEGLTQSTHAHLLSFAVLFALTGLIFSFTSYPGVVRAVVAPLVLVAQVLDVACWWLARIDGVGPYFAMAIVVNGTVVGFGLLAHIFCSLFNMYGARGKAVLGVLMLAGLFGFGVLGVRVIGPALEAERQLSAEPPKAAAKAAKAAGEKPAKEETKPAKEEANDDAPAKEEPKPAEEPPAKAIPPARD